MKLIDILARELKEWPSDFGETLGQTERGTLHSFSGPKEFTAQQFEVAEDWIRAKVGRVEWQAAADALKPPVWNGEGLPPVGAEIEALLPGLGASRFWQVAKVVHGALPDSPCEVLVFSLENTKPAWVDEFRPIRTPEQIAAEEREAEIEALVRSMLPVQGETIRVIAVHLHSIGYRKQVSQ